MHTIALMMAVASVWSGCKGASAGEDSVIVAQTGEGFWDHWGDGRAEIDTYTLLTPRYGEIREGSAVFIFVTEDFTDKQRVKSDGGHGDEYPVMKLNEIRHFQTGVYDYEVMTSTFLPLDGRSSVGVPTKVSFSAQEWCGHTYEQLVPRGKRVVHTGHSYFDGEADHDRTLTLPSDAVFSDVLPILARGIAGTWPIPGADSEVSLLDSLMRSRFSHTPPDWQRAVVSRSETSSTLTVPAGSFAVTELTVAAGTLVSTWQIEEAYPHRIIRFTTSEGEVGELVSSQRMPYWKLNREGDEKQLTALGLEATAGLADPDFKPIDADQAAEEPPPDSAGEP